MPDSDKALGQAVKQKPSDEFNGSYRDLFAPIFLSVFDVEGHHTVFKRRDSTVGNSDPVGIACQVFQNVFRPFDRITHIDNPLFFIQPGSQLFVSIRRFLPGSKRLMDTIRMIAYRAETAMIGLITGPTVDSSDARRLFQDLFVTEADILPDPENEQLNIRVHSASRPAANRALAQLFEHLNKAEVKYPGTEMRLTYELGGYTSSNYAEGVRYSSQR